jgi:hypothetical protein
MVKLPWEVLTPFSDLIKSLPSRQNRAEDDEEQDEDEMQAYQDTMQRLRVSACHSAYICPSASSRRPKVNMLISPGRRRADSENDQRGIRPFL